MLTEGPEDPEGKDEAKRPENSNGTESEEQAASTPERPAKPKRINLRRPDVMEKVQAQVESHYRSPLIDRIRANGDILSANGALTVKLAKEFGFCYGVERAIDLAYAARKVYPEKPLYILGEIIHNPEVNDQIRAMGIKALSGNQKDADMMNWARGILSSFRPLARRWRPARNFRPRAVSLWTRPAAT